MRPRAHAVGVVVVALVAVLVLPTAAFAAYGYNYGPDWSKSPWYDSYTLRPSEANIARYYQALSGYNASSFGGGWAEHVRNNMGAVSAMQISSHAAAGDMVMFEPNSSYWRWAYNGYTGQYEYTGNSMLVSNFPYNYSYVQLEPNGPTKACDHTARISTLNNSPMKILILKGCHTGADPSGYQNLLYTTVGIADMNFSGGFRYNIHNRATNPITGVTHNIGYVWTTEYWYSLYRDYYAGYSFVRARNKVDAAVEAYWGYQYYNWNPLANPNERL